MPDPRKKASGRHGQGARGAGERQKPRKTSDQGPENGLKKGQQGLEGDSGAREGAGATEEERVAGLLAAAAGGGQEGELAWREIIRLYGRRVYALAFSRCRKADLAEDVAQSVFTTIAAKLEDGYTEQGRFESWLFRIAMNRVRDELRRLKRHADVVDPVMFRDMHQARDEERPEDETLERLRQALAELSEADREIIELRHHGQMSFKQMADLLEEPLGTLLARHHRALRKLKHLMQEPEEPAAAGPTDERE